jgi:RNA polymerase sigma-70 factor (ECF subfamily)
MYTTPRGRGFGVERAKFAPGGPKAPGARGHHVNCDENNGTICGRGCSLNRMSTQAAVAVPQGRRLFTSGEGALTGQLAEPAVMGAERVHSRSGTLVRQAQTGDVDAFAKLVDDHQNTIFGIIYRMCGGGDDLQDLGQEVFVRAFQAIGKFQYRDATSFRTWLCRIAVNVCINELRRRKRRRRVEASSLDEMVQTENGEVERLIPDYSQMPHAVAEQNELQALVHEVLDQLSAHHRAVLVMVDIEGLSYEEAAQAMTCSLGTLKSRLSRARAAFKSKYQQYRLAGPQDDAGQSASP